MTLVKASWNGMFVDELAGVTDGSQNGHDDMADAASGAFMVLSALMHSGEEDIGTAISNISMGSR